MTQRRRLAIALFAACALGALVVGVVVGAGRDESPGPAPPTVAERTGRSLERTSFLARIVPLAERRERRRERAERAAQRGGPGEAPAARAPGRAALSARLSGDRSQRRDLPPPAPPRPGRHRRRVGELPRTGAARSDGWRGDRDLAPGKAHTAVGAHPAGRRRVQLAQRTAAGARSRGHGLGRRCRADGDSDRHHAARTQRDRRARAGGRRRVRVRVGPRGTHLLG